MSNRSERLIELLGSSFDLILDRDYDLEFKSRNSEEFVLAVPRQKEPFASLKLDIERAILDADLKGCGINWEKFV